MSRNQPGRGLRDAGNNLGAGYGAAGCGLNLGVVYGKNLDAVYGKNLGAVYGNQPGRG